MNFTLYFTLPVISVITDSAGLTEWGKGLNNTVVPYLELNSSDDLWEDANLDDMFSYLALHVRG